MLTTKSVDITSTPYFDWDDAYLYLWWEWFKQDDFYRRNYQC